MAEIAFSEFEGRAVPRVTKVDNEEAQSWEAARHCLLGLRDGDALSLYVGDDAWLIVLFIAELGYLVTGCADGEKVYYNVIERSLGDDPVTAFDGGDTHDYPRYAFVSEPLMLKVTESYFQSGPTRPALMSGFAKRTPVTISTSISDSESNRSGRVGRRRTTAWLSARFGRIVPGTRREWCESLNGFTSSRPTTALGSLLRQWRQGQRIIDDFPLGLLWGGRGHAVRDAQVVVRDVEDHRPSFHTRERE